MTHPYTDRKEAAEKATLGPWFNEGNTIWIDAREQVCCGRGGQECCGYPDIIGGQEQIGEAGTADAHFIALANPTRILALIEENERMREALTPFADFTDQIDAHETARSVSDDFAIHDGLKVGDFRRARAAFKDNQP